MVPWSSLTEILMPHRSLSASLRVYQMSTIPLPSVRCLAETLVTVGEELAKHAAVNTRVRAVIR
ncbi:hypothetical protein [Limihaloglobus sulfuriphilus]|uniref:hypothetical protein n=1 Tax=Limihaloglobus sulfuriphilus TaxID=1851148 RepID=UPI001649D1B2|nr:hypothetical protein [Limihaloglobus sulfuriphilus]